MLEQSLCEPPQESLSTESLKSEHGNLSVCENSEYRTPSPRINMVVRPQPDSQQERDVQKQPNDRMFSPLSQNWHIPHPVVDQQEDCNRQQEVQQTPPRYNSPGPTVDYNQQTRFLHTPTPDHVHFSPSVQHEQQRQQEVNSPLYQSFSFKGQPTTLSNFAQLQQLIFQHSHQDVNQYQHGYNSPHRLEVNQSQQPTVQSQTDVHSHHQLSYLQQHHSCLTNQQQGFNKVQQPLLPAQQSVQMQQKVQGLQQRLDQLQLRVDNNIQLQRRFLYLNSSYNNSLLEVDHRHRHQQIYHLTTNNISGLTYPSLGQPNLSGYQPQPLHVPYQQLPIPGTQQQPPTSGAPQPHYNQPSARPKEYNSDYYGRQRRSDPGHKYTGDSDTSDVSAYRQTRNKRRSEPEYNRPHEDQQRDFSPIRSVWSSPLHRSRYSTRRSRGSNDSQSESDTDGRCSKSSQETLDMIRWCQHTRKAVSAIQKTDKKAVESITEKLGNSPVVLGVGSSKSSIDNRLARMEEYMEKMMSTVTSLVQEQSAKHGTSPSSRSPNQDNRSSNYSPRRNYGRGRWRGNNLGDRRYTRRGYNNNECYNCHKQGHYIKDCPDLYVQDTGNQQSVQKEQTSQQVSFNENNKDDFYESEGVVSGISTVRSLGAAKLFRVEVDIAGKKVLALVDSGSEVTVLKDTIFDTLEPNPYVIRETTMYGAGTNMTMPCRLTSPIKFKIGHMQFSQQLYVAPVSCDMILGCDFIIQNKCVMNIGELLITVQNMNMPIMLGDDNTAHEPIVNIVHGSDSSSDEIPSTEGSTQRFTATHLSRQSADFHYETIIPQVESNLGMMASASTQEYDEREIQEEPDQCRDNKDQCCTNKVESRENLGFYTCPRVVKRRGHVFKVEQTVNVL
ncbi:unnamed protein product [Mytilus coruscus]|uniref:CCHC-type domain-containing protein n=1 Tax=Mytilus coruscus TaxID=42192 RepID=A0A6J7ZT99_MYTCO|nr:unnamed protein product [Mytilus coruscus]